ncbi:MAG: response regulator transcription factor [Chthoniobacterales bacterium]|nr:response regulator transcription factor [Chthoniobacterales bacterium]
MSLKCVIVEDQTMFLQMLHNVLAGTPGLEVVATAQTEAAGIAACEKHLPDILVLDLALPDGHGVGVARRLAQLKPASKTLILSGEASTFVCPSDLQDHVHAVLDKTQAFDDLAVEIKTLLPTARGGSTALPEARVRQKLSEREYEIFELIGRGLMSKEIGEKLAISTQTVQTHRKNIAEKLGTSGGELVHQAVRHYHATLGTKM